MAVNENVAGKMVPVELMAFMPDQVFIRPPFILVIERKLDHVTFFRNPGWSVIIHWNNKIRKLTRHIPIAPRC